MPVTDQTEHKQSTADTQKTKIIDCDIHPRLGGLPDLYPYFADNWLARFRPRKGQETGASSRNAFRIPSRQYFHPGEPFRVDAFTDTGGWPGSDLPLLQRQLLDEYGIDYAIIVGQEGTGLSGIPEPDLAAAFASAYNDYMLDVFVEKDDRLKLSLWVGPRDPHLAAKEIRRLADHPGVVQVQISPSETLMGNRQLYPIYEAAVEHGLPVAIHGGSESAGINGPILVGSPSYYIEVHSGLVQVAWAHLSSLVCEGVFERYPDLQFVMQEMGYAWIPAWMWRMDKEWRSLRNEVPWLKRPPSEYVLDHVKFTSQPIEEPPERKDHLWILEKCHADRTLMFSTDYPHWDFDNPRRTFTEVSDGLRNRIFGETAAAIYGL